MEAANLETWQALLAAELSPQRALEFGRKIESGHLDVKGFISNSSLSAIEAQRSAAAAPVDPAVQKGIQFVRRDRYPEFLAEVKLPPAGHFCWGDWETTFSPTVAIVGTRGASTYGKAVAPKFAEALARAHAELAAGDQRPALADLPAVEVLGISADRPARPGQCGVAERGTDR